MPEATTPPNPADEGGSRPVPDPTVLTTDALRREIAGLEKLINTKLEDAEKLRNEKFRQIERQFDESDRQRLEQKSDMNAAVAAALAAQKEAIAKTEASTDTQIAQLNRTLDTKVEALQSSHNDLKERVTVVEAVKAGGQEQRSESRAVSAANLATWGLILVVLNIVIGVLIYIASRPPM